MIMMYRYMQIIYLLFCLFILFRSDFINSLHTNNNMNNIPFIHPTSSGMYLYPDNISHSNMIAISRFQIWNGFPVKANENKWSIFPRKQSVKSKGKDIQMLLSSWKDQTKEWFRFQMSRGNFQRKMPVRHIDVPKFKTIFSLTNILIGSNVLVFLAIKSNPRLVYRLLKSNDLISRGQTYRLFTSVFTHQAITHLLMNCYSLYNIGPQVHNIFGPTRFLITYLFAGIFANVATYSMNSSPMSLGASGSIFGLIGAMGVFYFRNKSTLGPRADMGLESIKRTVMFNMLYSMGSAGIDNNAHVAGLVGGAIASFLIGPNLRIDRSKGFRRLIDVPIINIKRLIRYFQTPFNFKK